MQLLKLHLVKHIARALLNTLLSNQCTIHNAQYTMHNTQYVDTIKIIIYLEAPLNIL